MQSPGRGGPRKTSEWNKVLSDLGLGGGNGSKFEKGLSYAGIDDAGGDWNDLRGRISGRPKEDGGGGVFGFIANAAGDVKDLATGLPGAVKLGVDQVAGTLAGGYGYTVGLIPGTGGEGARKASKKLLGGVGTAFAGGAKQTASNWKRVATGDFSPLYEDPVFMALDAAALVSGGQSAAIKGAQVANRAGRAKVARVARNKKVVAQTKGVNLGRGRTPVKTIERELPYAVPGATPGTQVTKVTQTVGGTGRTATPRPAWLRQAVEQADSSGGLLRELLEGTDRINRTEFLADARSVARRTRSPIVVRREDFPLDKRTGAQVAVASEVAVPRRLAARTPLGRGLQAPFVGLGNRLREPGERLSRVPRATELSERLQSRQYKKAVKKASEELGVDRVVEVLHDAGARGTVNSIRSVATPFARKDPQAAAALTLHARGVFTPRTLKDGTKLSALDMRDLAVQNARRKLEEFASARDKNPKAFEENKANLELLESIPDELITLSGNSRRVKKLRRAVEQTRATGRLIDENDPNNLSGGWRDVKGERRTLTQRVLYGGAKFVEDAGPSGRVVVPEVLEAGKRVLGRTVASVPGVQRSLRRAHRAGAGQGNGQLAKAWLNKHLPERVKGLENEGQAVGLLRAVSEGRVRTRNGKAAPPGIREDARRAVANAEHRRRSETKAYTDRTELYRVRNKDGSASEWVVAPRAGEAPRTVVERARQTGGKVERVEVPTRVASKRQDPDGRIQQLPEQWERRGSEGARPVPGRDDVSVGGASNPRLVGVAAPKGGPRPLGLQEGLQPGKWLPEAQRRTREALAPRRYVDRETGQVRYHDTVENAVARQLIDSGEIRLTELSGVPRGAVATRAIERHLERRLQGRLPLTKDGQIDWDVLTPQIARDPVIRQWLNQPELLSRLPVDEGAIYVRDFATDALGRSRRANKGTQGRGPVGADAQTQQSRGTLSERLGFSLQASSIPATWDQIARSVGNQDFMGHVLKEYVLKDADGKARILDQLEASRLDETKYRVIPVGAFQRAEHALNQWTPAMGDKLALDGFVFKPKGVPVGERVFVVPREIGDHIQYLFTAPNKVLQGYDTFLHAWRGGVLAMAPRWFVNNYLGNTLFYGMFTGFDLDALRLAWGKKARDRLPYQIEGNTYSSQGHFGAAEGIISPSDAGRAYGHFTDGYFRVTEGGFRLNQKFEAYIRRAAYIHSYKKLFKENNRGARPERGAPGMSRKQRDAEMLEAIANAPDYLRRESLREMRQWMGDYTGLSRFERDYVRRVVPFYSWIRVLNTWLFGMPFRSPLRAEVLALAGQLGREVQGDRSHLPWWEQGRVDLTDSLSLRTSGMNPLMTAVEPLTVFGQEGSGVQDKMVQLLRSQGGGITQPLSILVGALSGRNPFGTRDYTNPLGYGGTVAPFGQQPQYYNTVTGQIDSVPNSPNVVDELMQMAPFAPLARDLLSWRDRPYDSTGIAELLLHRAAGVGNKNDLFQPEPKGGGSGREKVPGISPVLGILGAPIYRRDDEQERLSDLRRRYQYVRNKRSTKRQKWKQGYEWIQKGRTGG